MLRVRAALPTDYPDFARLFPELTAEHAPPSEARWLAEMVATTLIADEEGAAVGYLYGQPLAQVGYIRHLVAAPGARGRGVGRALVLAAGESFRGRGLSRWCLNVRPDNVAALRLYASVGMKPIFESVFLHFADWARIDALPEGPPGVIAGTCAPDEDSRAEADTGVLAGTLTDARARPGRTARVLRDGERFVGAGILDPDVPGITPFEVATPALAGALLRALRPFRRADLAHVEVRAEANPSLAAFLVAAGATERLRTLRYEGAL
ncbi:MAG: GNAT family N-acetyltransferase [Pseudomonadota bacterium]|nr:GNAT family N-acetyltransferase [Pseudomonadota bacterium]